MLLTMGTACAGMLEIVWRVSYAIITAIIGFMLLWRIFGLKENAHFAKRNKDTKHLRPLRQTRASTPSPHLNTATILMRTSCSCSCNFPWFTTCCDKRT